MCPEASRVHRPMNEMERNALISRQRVPSAVGFTICKSCGLCARETRQPRVTAGCPTCGRESWCACGDSDCREPWVADHVDQEPQALEDILDEGFESPRLSLESTGLFVPAEPIRLLDELTAQHTAGSGAAFEEVRNEYELMREMVEAEMEERGGIFEPLLSFEWASLVDWSASLELLRFRGRVFVCYVHEPGDWGIETPYEVIAEVRPEASLELMDAFLRDFFRTNGSPYGVHLWGGLPTTIENHDRVLVPRRTVAASITAHLEADPARWGGLRDQLDLASRHESPQSQFRELFGRLAVEGVEGYLDHIEQRDAEVARLPEKDKAVILEAYLERCYTES